HVTHPQLAPDLLHIDYLALVGKARVSGDHHQPRQAREPADNVLNHAISKILLFGVAAHVLKWQYRDRGFVGQRETLGSTRDIRGGPSERIDPYRSVDVLDLLLASVFEGSIDLTFDLIIDGAREVDASRFGHLLQSSRDVYAVTVDVTVRRDQDVAK